MSVIQYLKYNNYFNRRVKIETSYADYVSASSANMVQTEANFNPGDQVIAHHVCGKYQNAVTNPTEQIFDYDYVVVYSDDTYYSIVSRWFIIKADRVRGGQWNLTLKRDVIADYYDDVITAPAIIERARVDMDNPLIFNSENFSFNRIKMSETLLKDKTKIPWIVAYIPTDANAINNEALMLDPTANNDIVTVDDFPLTAGDYLAPPVGYQLGIIWKDHPGTSGYVYKTIISGVGNVVSNNYYAQVNPALRLTEPQSGIPFRLLSMIANNMGFSTLNTRILTFLRTKNSQQLSSYYYDKIVNLNGKIIKNNNDNKYYRVKVTTGSTYKYEHFLDDDTNTLFTQLRTMIQNSGIYAAQHNTINTYSITCGAMAYQINLTYEEVTMTVTNTFSMNANRAKCFNGMYDIIAIPCGKITIKDQNNASFNTNENIQKNLAVTLGAKLSGSIYDIQLLPFCPVQALIDGNNERLLINTGDEGVKFDYVKNSSDQRIGIMFYVQDNSFTFDIEESIPVETEQVRVGFVNPSAYSHKEYYITTLMLNEASLTDYQVATYENVYQGNDINNLRIRKRSRTTNEELDVIDASSMSVLRTDGDDVEAPYDYTLTVTKANGTVVISITGAVYESADYYYTIEVLPWNNGWPDVYTHNSNNWDFLLNSFIKFGLFVGQETAISTKIDSECDTYRLVSPNYQGTFEFCAAKNGGVDYFNVDVTLKPFNPYIHVNPNFKNMYGSDFNDARGLVCQGDFSYGQLTDRFQEYELNNKNYEAMFNRQIESMDLEHKLQKTEAIVGAIAGTAQGGASGAAVGSIGGPVGMAAGAVLGTAASAAGGIADLAILGKRQAEQKDLAIDMHEFQLGNIRAIPYTLTRCPAFTFNNKIFPFIEKYSATEEEIKAFKEYLELRSFNIGVVGTVKEYLQPSDTFIKAQIIRFQTLEANNYVAEDIYEEMNKGVYIK